MPQRIVSIHRELITVNFCPHPVTVCSAESLTMKKGILREKSLSRDECSGPSMCEVCKLSSEHEQKQW